MVTPHSGQQYFVTLITPVWGMEHCSECDNDLKYEQKCMAQGEKYFYLLFHIGI